MVVMRTIKDGMKESDLETIFKGYCEKNYSFLRVMPYTSIVGCGPGAATLHYIDNSQIIRNGQTMLVDQAH